ncbi:ABC transporter ATP-binding protein [Lactobacillus panisapium]|uniref:ABC transporter ATP-binding protein n=1 Tax=Lactobacillus panisapium TaxID=2012495 RepID=A0ABX8W9Q3_9LACO|nr:ABC transporter ATP-binding protein [Lactobacillus panisapium]QYN52918.1 ABC transporter ATP-binding protein [Lactobacillus panisapium]
MLKIEHLSKKYGDKVALDDISFVAEPNKILGLIGQNGAGKTTTFHSILNFINYDGKISWKNKEINEDCFDQIGYLPEERSLMQKLTLQEQIVYYAQLKGMKKQDVLNKIDAWLDRFEVNGNKSDKIKTLSKGNQQKVQLICTLIHQPKLIILDEPFSGLDPINAELLKTAILDAKNNGAIIIFSSHDMANVEEICDSLLMLRKGQTVLKGPVEEIRNSFSKNEILVKTVTPLAQLIKLPHVQTVEQRKNNRYLLRIDDEKNGPAVFTALTKGQYIEEYQQQAPTLDEIFRMKASEENA